MIRPARVKSVPHLIENLESRLLLTGTFSNPEVAADWTIAGEDVGGNLVLNNAGAITGGSETFDTGATVAGNGTYTLAGVSGALTLTTTQYTRTGAVSSTRDVFSVSSPGAAAPLVVGIKHTAAFTSSDATGSWDFYTDANSVGATGSGSFSFNAGHITGKFKNPGGTINITGSYTIDAAGVVTIALTVPGVGTLNFTGAMNNSKDVMAVGADNLSSVGTNPNMIVLTKRSGTYSKADLSGNWVVTTAGGDGTLVFDGKGKFSGSVTLNSGVAPVSGTYSITSTGLVTMHVKLTTARTFNYTLLASLNKNKNVIESVQAAGSVLPSTNSLTIFTRAEDAAPTVTTFTPPTVTMVGGVGKDFTSAQLLSMMNEGDIDLGDTVLVSTDGGQSVGIFVNGIQKFFPTTIFPGDTLTLVPVVQDIGKTIVHGVNLKVFDGSKYSANDVFINVKDVAPPVVSIAAAPPNADEVRQIGSKFTISRSGGDKSGDLTVHYTIGGTAANDGSVYPVLSGTAVIPAGQPGVVITVLPIDDGKSDHNSQTVTLTIATDSKYTVTSTVQKQSATITIIDANRAPTVTPFTPVAGTANTPITMSYSDLLAALGAVDPEGTPIALKLTGIVGSLTVNGTAISGTALVTIGNTVVWTPPANKTGTIKMFNIAALDLENLSSVVEAANATIT